MKQLPIDESFRSIEEHIREARAERARVTAKYVSRGMAAIARAADGVATRLAWRAGRRLATG